MATDNDDRDREETLRIVRKQTERTNQACSLLFQSWLNLSSQIVVGSVESVATTLRDLNDLYCDPRAGLGTDESSTRRRRRDTID